MKTPDGDGNRVYACKIGDFEDGKTKGARAYFAEPLEAPERRAPRVERIQKLVLSTRSPRSPIVGSPEGKKGPGLLDPGLGAPPSKGVSLRSSALYLAVDLVYEGLSVLVALLIGAQLLEVLDGEVIELLRDVRDG